MKYLILSLVILSGCATTQTEYVEKPIDRPVYCAQMPEAKEYETGSISKGDDIYRKVEALLVEREQRIATEAELRAIIEGCSKDS